MQQLKNLGAKKVKSLDSRLFAYALAGGAALVSATPANAAIIHYSGPTLDTAGSSFSLDVDGDLVNDFTFSSGSGTEGSTFQTTVTFSTGGVTDPLAFGTPVNAASSFGSSPYKLAKATVDSAGVVSSSGGAYGIGSDQYMGLSFDINGVPHYGWARVQVYSTGTPAVPDVSPAQGQLDVRLMEYAYETSSRADITTGQTTSTVPEPTSLAMFALGAAGIAAMRRRKAAR